MKEFIYYNKMLEEFQELFFQFKKIYTINNIRESTGLEDNNLGYILDIFINKMATLCCYNHEDEFNDGFFDFIHGNTEFTLKDNNICQVETIEELFDFYFSWYLPSNLIHIAEIYLSFGSETKDANLFLNQDNKYINLMYSNEELEKIAQYINNYFIENEFDENNNVYCFYDNTSFSILDQRYICIERADSMINCIKSFCEELNIDYNNYDF